MALLRLIRRPSDGPGPHSEPGRRSRCSPGAQWANGRAPVGWDPGCQGGRWGRWQGTLPEEALASFTRHDIEVITSGLVPTYTADVGLPISLLAIDGGLSRSGVCFLAVLKVIVVPAFFRSHLQVGFWPSGTRNKQPRVSKGLARNVGRLSPRGTQELTCHGRKRVGWSCCKQPCNHLQKLEMFP